MKKFGKFIFATVSLAAAIGGAYYFVKNIISKDTSDDFEDFDDEFEDFDDEEESISAKHDRGYVTLNLGSEEGTAKSDEVKETITESVADLKEEVADTVDELKEEVADGTQELKDAAKDALAALKEEKIL